MVTVVETWHLKPEHAADALRLMQKMDDLVGPAAHESPGWSGHATFLQGHDDRSVVLMTYRWRDEAGHRELTAAEDPVLKDFQDTYCRRERTIAYYTELDVDVDHDH